MNSLRVFTESTTTSRFTGLGRAIDPRIPSNRLVIVATLASGIILAYAGWTGSGSVDPWAILTGSAAVFIAWAIGREIDPDIPTSAAVAAVSTLLIALTAGAEAGGAAVILLGLRVLAGTVGHALKAGDYLVLILAAGYAGTRVELWPAAAVVVTAFLVDRPRWFGLAAATALGASITGALIRSPEVAWDGSSEAVGVGALALLAALASLRGVRVQSRTDSGHQIISSTRVVVARVIAGSAVAVSSFVSDSSFPSTAPALAAVVAVAIVSLLSAQSEISPAQAIRGHRHSTDENIARI